MLDVDEVKKRGGVGMKLLGAGAAVATGGLGAGLDKLTGDTFSNVKALGQGAAGLGNKLFGAADPAGAGGAMSDSPMGRRYMASMRYSG